MCALVMGGPGSTIHPRVRPKQQAGATILYSPNALPTHPNFRQRQETCLRRQTVQLSRSTRLWQGRSAAWLNGCLGRRSWQAEELRGVQQAQLPPATSPMPSTGLFRAAVMNDCEPRLRTFIERDAYVAYDWGGIFPRPGIHTRSPALSPGLLATIIRSRPVSIPTCSREPEPCQ
jgi:hypothetical protein